MTKFQLANNLAIAKRRTDRTQWNGDGRGGGERERERGGSRQARRRWPEASATAASMVRCGEAESEWERVY